MLTTDLFLNPASTEILPKAALDQISKNFQAALRDHNSALIKVIWNENPQLQAWFNGKQVNFGIPERADLRSISINEAIRNFHLVLASHSTDIIKAMWEGNLELQAWFSGKQVKFSRENTFDWRKISTDDALTTFNYALASHVKEVVKAMWEGNPELQAWFRGIEINFGTEKTPNWRKISNEDTLSSYSSVLASCAKEVIEAMWLENPLIGTWYSGETVNFGTKKQPNKQRISTNDALINFNFALASHVKLVAERMWKVNPQLRGWFSGKKVNFGTRESPDWRRISIDDVINSFNAALAALTNHAKEIIKAIWEGNPQLQAWFSGEQVNFGTKETPDWRSISIDEAINNFKLVLAAQRQDLIKAIWNGNVPLQKVLKDPTNNNSKLILHSVLNSSSNGKGDFITQYVKGISDKELLITVLKEMQENLKSNEFNLYKKNRIEILEKRLWELESLEQESSESNTSSIMPRNEEEMSIESANRISKKRKLAESSYHSRKKFKKHMGEIISSFVASFPPSDELEGLNYFSVEQQMGEKLQKLSKFMMTHMGIKSVTKVGGQPQYKVVIANFNKYNQLKKEHSQQVTPEFPLSAEPLNENTPEASNDFVFQPSPIANVISNNLAESELNPSTQNENSQQLVTESLMSVELDNAPKEDNFEKEDDFVLLPSPILNAINYSNLELDYLTASNQVEDAPSTTDNTEILASPVSPIERVSSAFVPVILSNPINLIPLPPTSSATLCVLHNVLPIESSPVLSTVAAYEEENLNFNENNNEVAVTQATTINDIISRFNFALANNSTKNIKSIIWNKNPQLRAWYSGEKVNFGTEEAPDWRRISIGDVIGTFNLALANPVKEIIKAMWEGNPQLQEWLAGNPINFSNTELSDFQATSIYDLIDTFKSVCANRCKNIVKVMWEGNPLLQQWFFGNPVNFGVDEAPDLRTVSLDDAISVFKSALSIRCKAISKAIWENNKRFQAWLSGEQVNFGTEEFPDLRTILLDDALNNFKSVLSGHDKYLIKAMWNNNPLLQAWLCGKEVDFDNVGIFDVRTIDAISNFKTVLASGCEDIMKVMWDENSLLQCAVKDSSHAKFILESVLNSNCTGTSKFIKQYLEGINDEELIKTVLEEIKTSNKSEDKSRYRKNKIKLLEKRLGELTVTTETDGQMNSLANVIRDFKSALSNRFQDIIKTMWNNNPQLQAWLSSELVNFGTEEVPEWRRMELDDAINIFKSVLASGCEEVIKAIWTRNLWLQQGIKNNISIAKLMLQKVLSSNKNGKSDFIVQYIKDINDKKLLKTVLKEINGNPKGKDSDHLKRDRYRKNRIDILERRIHELESSGFDQESSDSDTPDVSSMLSIDSEEMLTASDNANSGKRKITKTNYSSDKNLKKQMEEIISSFRENFPTSDKFLGERNNYFIVDQKIGEQLKKLSGIMLENMAIQSVIKVKNQSQYRVVISNLAKYNQLWNKKNQQLISEASSFVEPLNENTANEDNRFGEDNNFLLPPSPMINALGESLFDSELNNFTTNNQSDDSTILSNNAETIVSVPSAGKQINLTRAPRTQFTSSTLFAHRNKVRKASSPDSRDETVFEKNLNPNKDDNDIESQLSPSTPTFF